MKIEQIKTADLIPFARNARTHDEAQVAQIGGSIREFGFTNPILIDADNGIIAGHGRVLAARQLKMATVPCVRLAHLTDAQKRAYVIADNRLALNAGWDEELLLAELESIHDDDVELFGLTGFTEDDLTELTGVVAPETDVDAEPQVDRAAELAEQWGVTPGDLWKLGDHRLLCGDSTKADDVARCLGGAVPLLMVTDPPYGVNYDPSWRADRLTNKNKGKMGAVTNDNNADWTPAWRLFGGDVAYTYHAGLMASTVQASLELAGFEMRSQIVWAKKRMALSRGDYHWQHEPCWYAVRKGRPGHRTEDRTQTTLWNIPEREDGGHGHGTQKPVECMARPIRNHDSKYVYEPFCGSGTTIIACEQLDRKCRAIEISPGYVAVALQRYKDATGKEPKRMK